MANLTMLSSSATVASTRPNKAGLFIEIIEIYCHQISIQLSALSKDSGKQFLITDIILYIF